MYICIHIFRYIYIYIYICIYIHTHASLAVEPIAAALFVLCCDGLDGLEQQLAHGDNGQAAS